MNAHRKVTDTVLNLVWWTLLAATIATVMAARTRLLQFPLERDEGEYAYAGQLMLEGIPPYQLAYNMKFPGTYAAYALIMSIFGQDIRGVHLGLLIVNAATILVIFCLGRRLFNTNAGIAAAASYAVLSVSPSVQGFAAHATHFVMLAVLGGALLLLRAIDRHSAKLLFPSGLLFGVGLLMKQPAGVFVLFGAGYLLASDYFQARPGRQILRHVLAFCGGAITPLILTCLALWQAGVFGKFYFWTIVYAREYAGLVPFRDGIAVLKSTIPELCGPRAVLWVIAGIGLVVCLFRIRDGSKRGFLIGLLFCSLLGVCAGFYFRPHYFIFVLPAVSLLIGAAVAEAMALSGAIHAASILVFAAALVWPLFQERDFLFVFPVGSACRMVYPESPFPESIRIGQYIRDHSSPGDTIAVVGSEPEIYFYSHRHSATGYLYTYALMEPHKYAPDMQREMIREIESARPKYLVMVAMDDSWIPRPTSDQHIFNWANDYAAQNYSVVGLVNMAEADRTDYYFGKVPATVPSLQKYILIYQRNS